MREYCAKSELHPVASVLEVVEEQQANQSPIGCVTTAIQTDLTVFAQDGPELRFGTPGDPLNDLPLCRAAENIEPDPDVAGFRLG